MLTNDDYALKLNFINYQVQEKYQLMRKTLYNLDDCKEAAQNGAGTADSKAKSSKKSSINPVDSLRDLRRKLKQKELEVAELQGQAEKDKEQINVFTEQIAQKVVQESKMCSQEERSGLLDEIEALKDKVREVRIGLPVTLGG